MDAHSLVAGAADTRDHLAVALEEILDILTLFTALDLLAGAD